MFLRCGFDGGVVADIDLPVGQADDFVFRQGYFEILGKLTVGPEKENPHDACVLRRRSWLAVW